MWPVIGQDKIVSLFKLGLQKKAVAHAYLLAGPHHVGKMTLALGLAQALNCEGSEPPCGECPSCQKILQLRHADVQVVDLNNGDADKARTEISIDQIRQMEHQANLPPFEGKYKVFIINEAQQMSGEAANCLLKTLEEPVGRVVFILITSNESLLPATVVSRCQRLELRPLSAADAETALTGRWGVAPARARLLARLCHGCLGWAVSAAADDSLMEQRSEVMQRLADIGGADYETRFAFAGELATQFSRRREPVQDVLSWWLDWWQDLLLVKAGCCEAVTNLDMENRLADAARGYSLADIRAFIGILQRAREYLRQNVNAHLVLESLMLSLPRMERSVSA